VFGFFFQFSNAKCMGTFALLNIIVSKWLRNLSSLRIKLRKWNATTFGNLESKLKNTELRTITLESFNETRVLDDSEKDGLHFLNSELWPLSRKLESLRCQKSLTNWCKLEDFLFSRHL